VSGQNLSDQDFRSLVLDVEVALVLRNFVHLGHGEFWINGSNELLAFRRLNDAKASVKRKLF
jgi:hypothetical protein